MSNISQLISSSLEETALSLKQLHSNKIYFSDFLTDVQKIDIFPKKLVPPRGVQSHFYQKLITTRNVKEAGLILVPHEWQDVRKNQEYLSYLSKISEEVPVLVFNTGDTSPPVRLKNTIQIRTFLHPGENRRGKIIIPYPALRRESKIREWNPIPRVGFMGQLPRISPGSIISRPMPSIRYPIKSSSYLSRRLSIAKLGKLGPNIEVDLKTRPTFTAHYKNKDLAKHSQEFQDQLFNCDYILCPRGFGNTSIRFYEALSAGNTPILVESGGGMPRLKDVQDWENHILLVDLKDCWTEIILQDWESLSQGENYAHRQRSNLDLFNSVLDFDCYMTQLFSQYIEDGESQWR